MAQTVLVHMEGEAAFVAEVDEIPEPTDQFLVCTSPRRRDGRDVESFMPEVVTVLIPWHRIYYVELLPGEVAEDLITFVRE